ARDGGLRAAEAGLGDGKRLDREQLQAFELLTSGAGWVCLTGRAGTGKGPTLHAAAEAYRTAGWRVIACAMDGTTARRMADQLGGTTPALTVEQLRARLKTGASRIDQHTVIVVDEASKLDTGHWTALAGVVERYGARVRAIGHDGQHDAICLPGVFSEMLREPRIPTAELHQIRRHRDPANPSEAHPWLRDYQIAVDEGRGIDAVAILQEHQALKLYDTRAQAMGGIVEEWNSWRHEYEPTNSALIVHGPNSDVDLVNELAQQRRLDAGELGQRAIRALDRDYFLRQGDVVAIRNAAYTFPAPPGKPRPNRVENGQTAIVQSVDPARDTVTLILHEPGATPRLVQIDQARLRVEHAAGKRAAAVRLNYAMHSFPAQGATVHGTAALVGHWSQGKQATYVGDTRAVYRHTVHLAREDLGTNSTDEDRIHRYAQRIADNRQRHASIRTGLDPSVQLAVRLPNRRTSPGTTATRPASVEADRIAAQANAATTDLLPIKVATSAGDPSCTPEAADRPQRLAACLKEHRVTRLGDATEAPQCAHTTTPAERIAAERQDREAKRLQPLRIRECARQPAAPMSTDTVTPRHGPEPSSPTPHPTLHRGPTIAP
ncbi:MAG: ATP-dependent DNA helicase, partial [Sciscionella sp.]